jgi:hypothetical protein
MEDLKVIEDLPEPEQTTFKRRDPFRPCSLTLSAASLRLLLTETSYLRHSMLICQVTPAGKTSFRMPELSACFRPSDIGSLFNVITLLLG